MRSNWSKFILLLWKDWLLQYRHPSQTVVEIIAPIILTTLLVVLRYLVQPESHDTKNFPEFDPMTADLKMKYLAYSPINPYLAEFMGIVISKMKLPFAMPFNTSRLMEVTIKDIIMEQEILAGVQFDEELFGDVPLPKTLTVTLRFSGYARVTEEDEIYRTTWTTNRLFPAWQRPGPRHSEYDNGALPSYYAEQFLALQMTITNTFIEKYGGSPPVITMRRYPYPSWIDDPLLVPLSRFVGLIILLSYTYSVISTVKVITLEKERQLKEAMKIMGLSNWLHWSVWFVKTFIFLFLSSIIMVILLKIPWSRENRFSVFTFADPFILLLFLVCYICASITYCFMISVFFSEANTAAAVCGLMWFVFHAPYALMQGNYETLPLAGKLIASLLSNTAMAFGMHLIIMFESTGEGIQWTNVWSPVSSDDTLTVGYVMTLLLLDAALYLLIALYVEAVLPGEYGVPKVWYFPVSPAYWRGTSHKLPVSDYNPPNIKQSSSFFDVEPEHLAPLIQIRNLTKSFGKRKAVSDLTLNMYENQITVLLGHNGAGKTTTISMLVGIFPPSKGTAFVNGLNIQVDMPQIRENLGICPQQNIIFEEMTVRENMYFFCRLKGVPKNYVKQEIGKYARLLELVPKLDKKSGTLSGGMKRKLCVAIALCGGSKVVFLDEPTSGMDPAARRSMWVLLKQQKKDRTIILTTHFMDEADLLGDRIAIMAGGEILCCGSSFFLKNKISGGYYLVIEKQQNCDVDAVTDILKKYIPDIKVKSDAGTQLSYCIEKRYASNFPDICDELDSYSAKLHIASYGILTGSLEEVFMKIITAYDEEQRLLETKVHEECKFDKLYAKTTFQFPKETATASPELKNALLIGNQIFAMIMKRSLIFARSWKLFFVQILLPFFLLITVIMVSWLKEIYEQMPEIRLSLDVYKDPITVITGKNQYGHYVREQIKREKSDIVDLETEDIYGWILEKTRKDVAMVRNRFIVGYTFHDDDKITAWFNNQPFHSPAQSLALAQRAIVTKELGEDYKINITNHPLPYALYNQMEVIGGGLNMGFDMAFNVIVGMSFVSSFYVIPYVKERVIKAKHLQYLCGVKMWIFWIVSFLFDMLTFTFTCLVLVVTMFAFKVEGFSTLEETGRLMILFTCFGFCMLPLEYLASFMFDHPATGFMRMCMVHFAIGPAALIIIQILFTQGLDLEHVAKSLDWALLCSPHYSLGKGIQNLHAIYSTNDICGTMENNCMELRGLSKEKCEAYACNITSSCCNPESNFYKWEYPGVARCLTISFCVAIVLILILFFVESDIANKIHQIPLTRHTSLETSDEDSDVLDEKKKINNCSNKELLEYSVVLKNVSKYYKKFLAVNSISLGVSQYECFGLLGANGAGKTTTFRMMTGDLPVSSGNIWIKGVNLKWQRRKARDMIGYCPQFDALFDNLTGNEHMIIFGLIKGYKLGDSKRIADGLAREFDFHRHIHKKTKDYSGGNKRKLSTAIAVIGDPPVVFLDEPTTGMDPCAKRHLWNVMCRIREDGKCLVLTSHSMEECEALCTRLAVMVGGNFKCLGSTQHLKTKFTKGYVLIVKMQRATAIKDVNDFVQMSFPKSELSECHDELATFFIPTKGFSLGKIFGIMEKAKTDKQMKIEDYSIGQMGLEQVFLSFMETGKKDY